jgi:hypothetical protein
MENYHEMSKQDLASNHHWNEIQTTGQTTFTSDEEVRIITRDEVMFDAMEDLGCDNLYYDMVVTPLTFSMRVQEAFKIKLDEIMEEALNDYYM